MIVRVKISPQGSEMVPGRGGGRSILIWNPRGPDDISHCELFHAVKDSGDLLGAIAAQVAPPGTELAWVGRDFLLAQGEDDASLPLWPGPDPDRDMNAADPAAAYAAGLAPRPLAQSVREVHAAELASPTPVPAGTGLTAEREAELLARWRAA